MYRTLAAFLILAASAGRAETVNLAELKENEKMVVTYSSSGCFHFYTKVYTISGGAEKRFEASELKQKWNEEKKLMEVLATIAKGSAVLSEQEALGSDLLFEFYRSKPEGGCTTIDQIGVVYWRGGEKIGEESFTDATCSRGMGNGAVPLWKIEERIDQKPPSTAAKAE